MESEGPLAMKPVLQEGSCCRDRVIPSNKTPLCCLPMSDLTIDPTGSTEISGLRAVVSAPQFHYIVGDHATPRCQRVIPKIMNVILRETTGILLSLS